MLPTLILKINYFTRQQSMNSFSTTHQPNHIDYHTYYNLIINQVVLVHQIHLHPHYFLTYLHNLLEFVLVLDLVFFHFVPVLILLIHGCMFCFCCTFFQMLLLGILPCLINLVVLIRCDFFCLICFHIRKVVFIIINSFFLFLIRIIRLRIS